MTTLIGNDPAVRGAAAAIGHHPVDALEPTRLALHFGLQPVAAVAFTFILTRADFLHTVQRWNRARRAFVGLPTPAGFAAALDPIAAALCLHAGENELDRLPLPGRTLDEAYAWLAATIARHFGDRSALVRPAHDLPDHPIAHGQPFPSVSPAAATELAAWFELADAALAAVGARVLGAAPHCIWPHHFDMATLVELGDGKSIGLGFSPGDGAYAAPYFYVNLWPYPDAGTDLPALAGGGHWHTEGWTGAVLTADTLLQAEDRVAALDAWLVTAHEAARDLLG
jgi:hypothetical protein